MNGFTTNTVLANVHTDFLIRELIRRMGDDPNREGLLETPARVAASWTELFAGYGIRPERILKVFTEPNADEMVVVKDISFYSTCEHHLLPFHGVAHVAYVPFEGKVVGLSKIPRLVNAFARRLQVQERLTVEIATTLRNGLAAKGAACVMEATHLCCCSRGVRQDSKMVTSCMLGVFREKREARAEFLSLVKS